MKIRPFEDRVIIRQTEASKESDGVLLPDQSQVQPAEGVVVAVGPGVIKGDQVLLSAIHRLLKWAIYLWANYKYPDQARGIPDDASNFTPMQVKVGDYVIFGKYAGTKIKFDGEEFIMVRQADCFICDEEKSQK